MSESAEELLQSVWDETAAELARLVLRYFAGLDSKEIGRILQLPDSTVRSQLRTARKQLAWELKRAGFNP